MRLEANGLSFSYSRRDVLSDISFTIEDGRSLALLGRNGSGKTTLLRLLLGFLKPDEGEVLIDGRNAEEMTGRERARCNA